MADTRLYDLLRIGLTEGEAKVYLALLELGSSTVGPIVKKAGVAYSNVYDILNRLIEKGAASYIIKNKTRYFQAAGPSALYDYLDKREQELAKQKETLKEILPKLIKLQEAPEQEAEIFIGNKGLKAAYEKFFESIDSKDIYQFFYIYKKEYGEQADRFYVRMFNDMLKNYKIAVHGIANEEYRDSWFIKKVKKKISMRYNNFPIASNVDIYQDRILLVSWLPGPIAFLIKSKSVAEDFKTYFNAVWKTAKP